MDIRICQFFDLTTSNGNRHLFQNYYANENKTYGGRTYSFAPFRAEGAIASLNGENNILQILFPNLEIGVVMLQAGDGNRLSTLELTTVWLTADGSYTNNVQTEYYVGVGSSISDTTLELRFRSAIDSVTSNFPNRILTRELVGPLPLDAQLVLQ
jgi:phage-related protein